MSGVEIQPEVIGGAAAGSAVALRWFPGDTWVAKLANFGAGWVIGVGCSLFASWYVGITAVSGLATIGFFSGVFGISAADKAQEFVRGLDIARLWNALFKKGGAE